MALQSGVTILNKYRIVKLLGEGGMARVWLAEELTFGKRLVALKEPRPNPLSDDVAEIALRYQREVQVCAELEQAGVPQLVRAITAEPYEDGLLLVMAYMPGGDLASLIKQHPNGLPPERAVAIALDVLDALGGAHSHPMEIIHRDVKPSNILFDKEGRASLADFGLAQLAGVSGRSQLRGGQHPGTPQYMAPEQERSSGYLSPAADLFALGCVLWEMLTGQRYKRHKPGTPPSQLRNDMPAWLDQAAAKALSEDPWERWQSAAEMFAALAVGQAAEQQAQQAAAAQLVAAEQAKREAETRRAAEEQARQEATQRKEAEAAERARQVEAARQRRQKLTALFAEAQGLVEQQPAQALGLVAQIRSIDPTYPGLTGLERRARKAQKKVEGAEKLRPSWLGRAAVVVALLAVVVLLIGAFTRFIGPGGDATSTPTATSAQPVAVKTVTYPLAPPTETLDPATNTPVPSTHTPVPDTPGPSTSKPASTHTSTTTNTPTSTRTATPTHTLTPQPDAVVNTQNANLRSGPGTEFPVIGSYPLNTPLQVLRVTPGGDWVEVRVPDTSDGWMAASLLRIYADLKSIPTASPIPTSSVAVTNTPSPSTSSVWYLEGDGPFSKNNGIVRILNYTDRRLRVNIGSDIVVELEPKKGTARNVEVSPGAYKVVAEVPDLPSIEIKHFQDCNSIDEFDRLIVTSQSAIGLPFAAPKYAGPQYVLLDACPFYLPVDNTP